MILTTTNSVEGFRITDYKGIVTGISYDSSYNYKGASVSFKDMFNMSKYYDAYESGIESIKESAFQKLQEHAKKMGANAIVGIKVDIEPMSSSHAVVVSVTGTAVVVQE